MAVVRDCITILDGGEYRALNGTDGAANNPTAFSALADPMLLLPEPIDEYDLGAGRNEAVAEATGVYVVASGSGSTYRVKIDGSDAYAPTAGWCPAAEHNGGECKHQRRLRYLIDHGELPGRGESITGAHLELLERSIEVARDWETIDPDMSDLLDALPSTHPF